jgi:hypothetical protein
MNNHCCICKKPLSDFTSVKIGMGPVCRKREAAQKELFDDFHAVFNVLKETRTFIFIKDTGHKTHKSVTNDVDFVLAQLSAKYNIEKKRIFYVDSMDRTDEIIHHRGRFLGFRGGHQGVEL